MMLNKTLALVVAAMTLSACSAIGSGQDSAGNINQVRGKNGMMLSDAEAKQHKRQRQAELEESATRNAKTQMNMSTAREGMGVVREGLDVIRDIKSFFNGY